MVTRKVLEVAYRELRHSNHITCRNPAIVRAACQQYRDGLLVRPYYKLSTRIILDASITNWVGIFDATLTVARASLHDALKRGDKERVVIARSTIAEYDELARARRAADYYREQDMLAMNTIYASWDTWIELLK